MARRVCSCIASPDYGIQRPGRTESGSADRTGWPVCFRCEGDHTVESRPIVTGARVEEEMVVSRGLEAGETVVTEGQLRLAPGTRVQVRDGRGGPGGPGGAGGRKKPIT